MASGEAELAVLAAPQPAALAQQSFPAAQEAMRRLVAAEAPERLVPRGTVRMVAIVRQSPVKRQALAVVVRMVALLRQEVRAAAPAPPVGLGVMVMLALAAAQPEAPVAEMAATVPTAEEVVAAAVLPARPAAMAA